LQIGGEDTTNFKKGIQDAFEKVDNLYTEHGMRQEERLNYQKIWIYYIKYNGVELYKYVKV
jgi:hypothetical protein